MVLVKKHGQLIYIKRGRLRFLILTTDFILTSTFNLTYISLVRSHNCWLLNTPPTFYVSVASPLPLPTSPLSVPSSPLHVSNVCIWTFMHFNGFSYKLVSIDFYTDLFFARVKISTPLFVLVSSEFSSELPFSIFEDQHSSNKSFLHKGSIQNSSELSSGMHLSHFNPFQVMMHHFLLWICYYQAFSSQRHLRCCVSAPLLWFFSIFGRCGFVIRCGLDLVWGLSWGLNVLGFRKGK